MQEIFTPSVIPPKERTEKAHFFAFRGDQLLVALAGEEVHIPFLMDFAELDLPVVEQHYLGISSRYGPCYAVELPEEVQPPPNMAFRGLRQLYRSLEEELLWIGGRGIQIIHWHRDHQYCGHCGAPTRPHPEERAMVCDRCNRLYFPRLSPAIIVLVRRGESFLLARNHRFPPGRYSLIAGFVEPGESLEEAVAREVREEVGLVVQKIRYFGSQSWPFPHSLMLGFIADHAAGEIRLDGRELADAGWYPRDRNRLPELPDGLSISRKLIDWFLEGREMP